eukprot:gene723-131_t
MEVYNETLLEQDIGSAIVAAGNPAEVKCKLIPGATGVFIQALLGCVSVCVLFLKHKLDKNQRTVDVFLRDSSKQIIGGVSIHFMNMLFAVLFSMRFGGTSACHWYFIQIVTDTTVGVVVIYWLLKWSQKVFGYESGNYHDSQSEWVKQLLHYVLIVIGMKIIMGVFQTSLKRPLLGISDIILAPVESNPIHELIVVMIFTPLVMNSFQLITIDIFLRAKEKFGDSDSGQAPLVPRACEE